MERGTVDVGAFQRPLALRHRRRWLYGAHLMAKKSKDAGGGKAFGELMRALVQVPKKELDRAERRYQKRKAAKRRK